MRSRIFFKLLLGSLLIIAAATVTMDFAVRRSWESSLVEKLRVSLTEKAELVAQRLEDDRMHSVQEIADQAGKAGNVRVTIIYRTGKVLADSQADPSTMENHANRPEFIQALQKGSGSSVRHSHTLDKDFIYVAVPLSQGAVRLAYPLNSIKEWLADIRNSLLEASLLALLVAMLLAGLAAHLVSRRLRRIVAFSERVAAGDLTARIAEPSLDEIGQVAAALDLTARRLETNFGELQNSQQQMLSLLNSMQEAVIAVSRDRTVIWANGAMELLIQGRSRNPAQLTEVVRDPAFLEGVTHALESGQVTSGRVRTFVPGRVFELTVAPMPGGVVAVLHDITAVERVEKTRRDFIANVSHELRTPLTSIQGYAETLLDSGASLASGREFLEIIRKNADRMARLTEDLLTLARVESGEQKLEFAPVSSRALLSDAAASFRELARSRGVELSVVSGEDSFVRADSDAIHQVFSNLLDNAIKYGGSGGSVEIGARRLPGGETEFFVRDFGSGVASVHLPRLFERFYRVDKARSREAGGTGLGLAIVKHIVLNHSGSVRAESELGHGITFYFTVPGAAVPVHPEPQVT